MTRDIDWGIPVPVEGYPPETKRIYVWFDAVIGYLSAAVEWAQNRGTPEAWREWWQNPDSTARVLHGQGQHRLPHGDLAEHADRLRQGRRAGAGKELHLPDEVVASEFLTMEGKQLSTSRAVAIYVRDVLERYDPDPGALLPHRGRPGDAGHATSPGRSSCGATTTSCSRTGATSSTATLTNAHRNFGEVPDARRAHRRGPRDARRRRASGFESVGELIEQSQFKAALAEAMRLSSIGNQYVDHQAPWAVIKDDRERAGDDPLRRAPRRRLAQDHLHALPAVLEPEAARAARLRGLARRPARVPRGRGGGRREAHGSHGRLLAWIGVVGAERPAGRAEAPRAGAAVQEARSRDRRRRAAPARRGVIDTHAHLDALDDPAGAVARARAGRSRRGSSRSEPTRARGLARLRWPKSTRASSRSSGLHPHEAAADVDFDELERSHNPSQGRRRGRDRPRLLP